MRYELEALRGDIAALAGLRDEVARVSELRGDLAALGGLREEVGAVSGAPRRRRRARLAAPGARAARRAARRAWAGCGGGGRAHRAALQRDARRADRHADPGLPAAAPTAAPDAVAREPPPGPTRPPPRELTGAGPPSGWTSRGRPRQFGRVRATEPGARRLLVQCPPPPGGPCRPAPVVPAAGETAAYDLFGPAEPDVDADFAVVARCRRRARRPSRHAADEAARRAARRDVPGARPPVDAGAGPRRRRVPPLRSPPRPPAARGSPAAVRATPPPAAASRQPGRCPAVPPPVGAPARPAGRPAPQEPRARRSRRRPAPGRGCRHRPGRAEPPRHRPDHGHPVAEILAENGVSPPTGRPAAAPLPRGRRVRRRPRPGAAARTEPRLSGRGRAGRRRAPASGR